MLEPDCKGSRKPSRQFWCLFCGKTSSRGFSVLRTGGPSHLRMLSALGTFPGHCGEQLWELWEIDEITVLKYQKPFLEKRKLLFWEASKYRINIKWIIRRRILPSKKTAESELSMDRMVVTPLRSCISRSWVTV